MRYLWVPLLLAPAGVVFVGTRTAIDPIASAERLDVVPHIPATIELPTAAIGIATPARRVTVRVHTRRPAKHRVAKVKRPKVRIAPSPRPAYVVPRTVVAHVTPKVTAPHAAHTPKPTQTPKPRPKPTPAPLPTPVPTPAPAPTPPTTTTTTPPAQPPAEPPVQPIPTPAAPPAPAPAPPAPSPAPAGGDDDQGDDEGNGDTRPGNGWGDRNHEHTGPPGRDGGHGGHGH